jgi:S-formylglutathione hydrolase FrmB
MALLTIRYHSETLRRGMTMEAILPDAAPPPEGWPVVYMLHGLTDDQTAWLRRSNIERHAARFRLAVVMPNAERSWYTDSLGLGHQHATHVAVEVPTLAERWLPVRRDREGRGLAGLSMGGYGSIKLALQHPDRFAAAFSMSGAMRVWETLWRYRDDDATTKERLMLFGSDPKGTQHDIFHLAQSLWKASPDRFPALAFNCGTDDYLLECNREFAAFLQGHGIPHEYEEFPGAHDWDYWDARLTAVLRWMVRRLPTPIR